MKHFLMTGAAALLTIAMGTPHARAEGDALRVAVAAHDVQMFGLGGTKGKEASTALALQYLWDSPDWLSWIDSPQPYIGGSVNLNGETSHAGFGLNWQGQLAGPIFTEMGLGLVLHDGELTLPRPEIGNTAQEIANKLDDLDSNIEYGSRALFRVQFAFGYRLTERTSVDLYWEHLSNGTVFANANEGVDNIGLRLGRKF